MIKLLSVKNNLSTLVFKPKITTSEVYLLFFLSKAEKCAIIQHFRKSYFFLLLGLLGLTRDESKEILKSLIKSGHIIPLRRFGYAVNAIKAKHLINSVDEVFFEIVEAKYSKDQLLSLLEQRKFLEGEQNDG